MYPDICPGCGADLTRLGGVTEVQEMYTANQVEDGDLVDNQNESVGDNVRAFCSECGHSFYNEKDVDFLAYELLAKQFASITALNFEYVMLDFRMIAKIKIAEQND
jgi:hypothetical protein